MPAPDDEQPVAALAAPVAPPPSPAPDPAPAPELAPALRPRRRALSTRALATLAAFVAGGAVGALLIPLFFAAVAPSATTRALPAPTPQAAADTDAESDAGPDAASDADADGGAPHTWRVASLASAPAFDLARGTVGKRTLDAALRAAGLAKSETARIYAAFDGVHRLDRCHPHDAFVAARERATGRVVAFELSTSPVDVWQAKVGGLGEADAGALDGELHAAKLDLDVATKRVAVAVAVTDDLRASVTAAGLDDDVLERLDDALDGHAELSDLRAGARLRVVATEERIEGQFARYAQLDAVEYVPARGPSVRVYWFLRDGATKGGGYYDKKGHQPYHGAWRAPIPFARITSRFDMHRMHPVLHVVMPHNGVDFGASSGTPIYAAAAGVVSSAGDSGACGNMVTIHHDNNLTSGYCHMSRFASGVHTGLHVEARQLIGYVGATGRVTGPHLHFWVKRGDTFIDPLSLRLDGVRVLPPADRDDFAARREELDAVLDAIPLPAAGAASDADAGADGGEGEMFYEEPP